ncbi:hypothetical protein QPM17_22005 [Marinobacter sp. TBZ242]|uniref:Uncharacterized protein n=1 Tax=Marinobacter azerbaijanicus TaxID=3050455 RepID=A0ABT7II13_9GAMM|nr:hypothetical protein [Marinobacter sp. TBZ242]MDL0433819.1 hypothetical protein [Marinobacter sp. TBZ242]
MITRDKIEAALESPGWMRLWKAVGGLWAAVCLSIGLILLLFGGRYGWQESIPFLLAGLLVPICLYQLGKLIAWVVRGFLE